MNRLGTERMLSLFRERLSNQQTVDNIAQLDAKRPLALEGHAVYLASAGFALGGRQFLPPEIES